MVDESIFMYRPVFGGGYETWGINEVLEKFEVSNTSVIHPNISLSSMFYVVDVDLDDGYNNIDFIALNEGESSPNTAQLIVLDEFGKQLSNKKWLISTGYKAKLVVFKK